MISLPNASTNWVAPRPRKKAQLLPATKSTEFTSDNPAIQMSQLAPARLSCACFAISVMPCGGPVGLGGVVLGGPVVLMRRTGGNSPLGRDSSTVEPVRDWGRIVTCPAPFLQVA